MGVAQQFDWIELSPNLLVTPISGSRLARSMTTSYLMQAFCLSFTDEKT
jgi:hypothetical protein